MDRINIIGAGAWGTALAMVIRRTGRQVMIQSHEADVARAINRDHENPVFLPGVTLDPGITATTDTALVVKADAVLLAVPAQFLRAVLAPLADIWPDGVPAVICAKGIEMKTCALMSEVVAEILPAVPVAVLSGPTFAAEVAHDLPTAVTLAATDGELGRRLSEALGSSRFRAYRSDDVIGAQVGGAVKNVLAIGCGIVQGLDMGDNTRASLITRGLTEIVRLAVAKGGRAETLMGLSGLGDLTLTCNAMQSRNFSLGVALGEGRSLDDILGTRTSVAEGVSSAASVCALADRLGVDMPISKAVDGILNHGLNIDVAIANLLSRPVTAEGPFSDDT